MNTSLFVTITLISCIGSVAFLAAYLFITYKKGQQDPIGLIGEEFSKNRLARFRAKLYQKAYLALLRTKILRRYMLRIRKRIETVHAFDEYLMRKETAKITLISLGSTLLVAAVLLTLSTDIMYILWVIFGAVILNNVITDYFVNRMEDKLLVQLAELFEDIRHNYQQHNMVDEAIYEALHVASKEAATHANRVYEVLIAEDPKRELESYYSVAPNKYLKVFAGVSHMVMEYGDRQTPKGSMYLQTLSKLVQEINMERIRREKLYYKLQGLVSIAVFPIVLLSPIEDWAMKFFPIMEEFYNGKVGFAIKVSMFVLTLLCYMLLKRLSQSEHFKLPVERRKESLLQRWPKKVQETGFGRWLLKTFGPMPKTRQYHRTAMLLKDTNSPFTVEWFFINRWTLAAFTFLSVVVFFVAMHANATYRIYNAPTALDLSMGTPTSQAVVRANELTQYDNQILRHFRGMSPTKEQIAEYLMEAADTNNVPVALEAADRIYGKMKQLEDEVFKWWELLLAFILAGVAYNIPVWFLEFQRRMKYMDMQSEVNEFHVLISILSQFERASVEMILEWMERYARIFRQPLQTCLMDYDAGAQEALENLKYDAPFVPFTRIVEKLQLAVDRIPIAQAFDDLESEMEYYKEQRKLHHEKSIEQKSAWGLWIGFTPGMAIIFLYMVAPLLYASVVQMNEYIAKLEGL